MTTIDELNRDSKPATPQTAAANAAVYDLLDFSNTDEADCATRGLIESPDTLEITADDGRIIWSQDAYAFLDELPEAPDTANPSLWQNAKNNHAYGLFEVREGIYQVRGYDMANLTLVAGDTGWIILDTTMTVECARACMDLAEKHLGKRPVRAIIVSHPHVDHFGGLRAFVQKEDLADPRLSLAEQVASGKVPIIVPERFTRYAVSENLFAGTAMGRRANYQYGIFLTPGARGSLSIGIGMGQSKGTLSFLRPTYEVRTTGETISIDGVEMEFHMTPGTEAPAEMNTWFPGLRALWVAENCTGTLHNLYTLRGAEIRDGNAWAHYIMEAYLRYGDDVEVTFQSHNWPHWGNAAVREYLLNTAAVYEFINDQTISYMNEGYTPYEISKMIRLTPRLEQNWYTRPYYGTVAHDSRAVYQKYLGSYDANPVHLNSLTPTESAKKWVAYLGGTEAALAKAREDFAAGEYQWVAELTNTIVFAEPDNIEARLLCADALEQLGYQAESGTWRNCYLSGALELRLGNQTGRLKANAFGVELMANLTPDLVFDYLGILIDRQRMADERFAVAVELTDLAESYTLYVHYGPLLWAAGTDEEACATLRCPLPALLALVGGRTDIFRAHASFDGETDAIERLLAALVLSAGTSGKFNIIEP